MYILNYTLFSEALLADFIDAFALEFLKVKNEMIEEVLHNEKDKFSFNHRSDPRIIYKGLPSHFGKIEKQI